MKVYTAGPITGLSYDQVMNRYRKQVAALREYGYNVICPMVGHDHLKGESYLKSEGYSIPTTTSRAIKSKDMWMVRQADIVLVDFTDSLKASIGSCFEMAWANMLGKHVLSVIPETNVHRHAFVLECSDIVFTSLNEAYEYLKALADGIET